MTSDLRQYIAGYTVANLLRYPIRRLVAFASALELSLEQLRSCDGAALSILLSNQVGSYLVDFVSEFILEVDIDFNMKALQINIS